MRSVTIVKNLYKFEELSKEAKTLALDINRHINVDEGWEWYSFSYEEFKEAAEIIGLDVSNIMFSGFSCQGDGASFEGTYQFKSGGIAELEKFIKLNELPEDCIYQKMLESAKSLQEIQKRYFYSISLNIKKNGRYCHSGEMSIDFDYDYDLCGDRNVCDDEKSAISILRSLADYLYNELDNSYYSLISDESVKESIQEMEFFDNGKTAGGAYTE